MTLSPKELEVLRLYATGIQYKAIGPHMGLALQTVKNHFTSAYAKLDVNSAIGAFIAMGWLRPEGHHE